MPDMMQWACVEHATTKPSKSDRKSKDATGFLFVEFVHPTDKGSVLETQDGIDNVLQ